MAGARTKPLRNPLPSWHPEDRQQYASLVQTVCDCKPAAVRRIVEAFPSGHGLAAAPPSYFRHLGLTDKQAKRISAAFVLARFAAEGIYQRGIIAAGPDDVRRYLMANMNHLGQEVFVAILLDSRLRVIDTVDIARGTISQVDVSHRELFRQAIQLGTHSIIVAHNHPSGTSEPSEADLQLTQEVVIAGRMLGIPVVDSMVVGYENGRPVVTSLRADGYWKPEVA